jgi:hypothetical protein
VLPETSSGARRSAWGAAGWLVLAFLIVVAAAVTQAVTGLGFALVPEATALPCGRAHRGMLVCEPEPRHIALSGGSVGYVGQIGVGAGAIATQPAFRTGGVVCRQERVGIRLRTGGTATIGP